MSRTRSPSLTAIALECGFSSSSDFSRCFKQRFGVPPRSFDLEAWRQARGAELTATVEQATKPARIDRLPPRHNPDSFRVKIRDIPVPRRGVHPRGQALPGQRCSERYPEPGELGRTKWARGRTVAWLSVGQSRDYLFEHCRYYVAVEAERFIPKGEVARHRFPPMVVAQVEIRGGLDLELRALQWLYGSWLPRSGYVPDDHPCFEAWIGRPFAHGTDSSSFSCNCRSGGRETPIRAELGRRGFQANCHRKRQPP